LLTSSQVLFGDPFDGQPLPNIDASKVKTFCFEDDLICQDLPVVDAFHLAYGVDAVPAAEFVQSKVQV
jgi:cutinase